MSHAHIVAALANKIPQCIGQGGQAPAAQGPSAQPTGKAVERLKEDMDWMDQFLEKTRKKEE